MLRRIYFFYYLKLGLIISIAGWVQIIILPSLWFLKIKPDLLLITAVILALKLNSYPQVILFVCLCGLLKDIFSIHLFGFNALMFCAYGSFVYFISGYLYKETPWLKFIFLACATLLHYFCLSIIFARPYLTLGVLEAVVNCLFLPLATKALWPFLRMYSDTEFDYAHK